VVDTTIIQPGPGIMISENVGSLAWCEARFFLEQRHLRRPHFRGRECKRLHPSLNVYNSLQSVMYSIDGMSQIQLRTPADIGALIKDRRRMLRLDQADLAQRIGVSRLWVSQIERGKPGASLALILRAFAALGIELTGHPVPQDGLADAPHSSTPRRIVTPDINAIIADARLKDRS